MRLVAALLLTVACGISLPQLPTPPPPSPTAAPRGPCIAADLEARFRGWTRADVGLVATIAFGNRRAEPCTVQGAARMRLLDRRNQQIGSSAGPNGGAPHPIVRLEPSLGGIPPSPQTLLVGHATALLQWVNWCRTPPDLARVAILLPGDRTEVLTEIALDREVDGTGIAPRCETSSAPTRISVGAFQAALP